MSDEHERQARAAAPAGGGAAARASGGVLLEVPADRLLQDWQGAHARALSYLEALGVAAEDRRALATQAVQRALHAQPWSADSDADAETRRALETILEERAGPPRAAWDPATDDFLEWRVEAGFGPHRDAPVSPGADVPVRDGVLWSMPPLLRGPMVPAKIERRFFRRVLQRARARRAGVEQPRFGADLRAERRQLPWPRVARRRRLLLSFLVLIPSVIASGFMVNVLPDQGRTPVEVAIVFLFGALFGWISIGFWTATLGFFTLVGRRDRFAITNGIVEHPDAPIAPEARTAIVMPICEEPVERVFAGLKAIRHSLERAGVLEHFHFFILSDTQTVETAAREEAAWATWCRDEKAFDSVFYRRRKVRLKRKSGNVADFCRCWRRKYR